MHSEMYMQYYLHMLMQHNYDLDVVVGMVMEYTSIIGVGGKSMKPKVSLPCSIPSVALMLGKGPGRFLIMHINFSS